MTKVTDTGTFSLLAGDDGVDPIEDRSRANARGTIEAVFNEELDSFLGRLRHGRKTGAVKGYRHGSRDHRITGTFGTETISVPRARIRPNSRWSVPRWRPRRRAISVTDKPISIMPVSRDRTTQPRPKIDPWRSELDEMLVENGRRPKRERLTLIRICEELRIGPPTRSPMKLAAATTGPGLQTAQRENE